jgi:hypothetical protein
VKIVGVDAESIDAGLLAVRKAFPEPSQSSMETFFEGCLRDGRAR